jgi:hypothetical protein
VTAVQPERASWGTTRDPSRPHQIVLVGNGSEVYCRCNCGRKPVVQRAVITTLEDDHWRVYASHLNADMIMEWGVSDYDYCWDYLGLPERLFQRWLSGDL